MRKEQTKLLAVFIGILLLLIVLNSCTTQRKVQRYLNDHREVAAKYCSETFAPRDCVVIRTNTSIDTVYAPLYEVDTVILFDTLINEREVTLTKSVKVPCPLSQIITRTVTRDSIVFQPNVYEEERLKIALSNMWLEKQSLIAKADEAQDKLRHRNKLIWWLLLVIAGETVYIFRKPLMSLVMRIILPIKNIYPF